MHCVHIIQVHTVYNCKGCRSQYVMGVDFFRIQLELVFLGFHQSAVPGGDCFLQTADEAIL